MGCCFVVLTHPSLKTIYRVASQFFFLLAVSMIALRARFVSVIARFCLCPALFFVCLFFFFFLHFCSSRAHCFLWPPLFLFPASFVCVCFFCFCDSQAQMKNAKKKKKKKKKK